jgi:hypothetical protein
MKEQSTRLPSPKYLTAQSLFLDVNGSRDKRLQSYQAKANHDKSYAHQLAQELEADLSFYCESQREVDRLLDEINRLKLRLFAQELEAKLERSIIQDFIKGKQLDLELIQFSIEKLKPKLIEPTVQVA